MRAEKEVLIDDQQSRNPFLSRAGFDLRAEKEVLIDDQQSRNPFLSRAGFDE